MIHEKSKKERFEIQLKNYLTNDAVNSKNKQIAKDFFKADDLDQFQRKINPNRRLKYLTLFHHLERWFNHKHLLDINKKDFEKWYLDLKNDSIKQANGKVMSENTKATYRVMLKTLWKWLKGNNEIYPEEVKNFRPNWQKKEPQARTRQEVEKIALSFKDPRYRFATLFLFDSGFRIDEFINMKRKNIKIETRTDGKEYYTGRCEVSKTKPRTVALTLYPQEYNNFLEMFHGYNSKPEDPLVNMEYFAYRKALGKQSLNIIGKRIAPHDLRRASATYYAGVLKDPFQLNIRFGWATYSDVGSQYIDRLGISQEKVVDIVETTEINDLKKQVQKQEREKEELKKRMEALQLEFHQQAKASQSIDEQMIKAMEDKHFQKTLLKKFIEMGLADKLKEDLKTLKIKTTKE